MRHIIKSTIHNFIRKPAINLINLLGLAVSLALVIILSVYCYSELTTDHFHKNGDRVYLFAQSEDRIHTTSLLKEQVDLNIPNIELTVRVAAANDSPVFQVDDKDPVSADLFFADDSFFCVFTYQSVFGDPIQALKEPLTLVVTRPFAEKLFGTADAVGRIVKWNNDKLLTVKAVVNPPSRNSVFLFQAMTSVETKKILYPNPEEFSRWGWTNYLTFMRLKEGINPVQVTSEVVSLVPETDRDYYQKAKLIPLKKLYFTSSLTYFLHLGDKRKVLILVVVAALILVIALVNFLNISSAQWLEKIRHTGVQKVLGAKRASIVANTLAQTLLFFLAALLIAVVLAVVLLPFIRNYTGINFSRALLLSPQFWLVSIAVTCAMGILFSLVPALRISSSNAVDNLKKTINNRPSGSTGKGILVTAQFTIAIVLISFTVLIEKQVDFGSSELGINQENIVGIRLTRQLSDKKDVLKQLLEENPNLRDVSLTQYYPGKTIAHLVMEGEVKGEKRHYDFHTFQADVNFLKIMGLQLVQGRFYSNDLSSDANKAVVNETFVREHKMEDPIGKRFFTMNGDCEIIGVVKDFHYRPFNEPIAPLAIQNGKDAAYCLVNLQSNNFNSLHSTLQKIRGTAAQLSPSFPVEINFFDQAVEQMYQSELQFRRTFTLIAGSAIVICCMGILAMSLFASQRRIKEIGIRKVNGAKTSEILAMLNKDFVKWVAIAFVIATPIARYSMNTWLENFAYKTTLSWWIFALAGLLALGIALLTVSFQSWKAATRNPVESLRYE
jgi:putative ABC transport system permease protein